MGRMRGSAIARKKKKTKLAGKPAKPSMKTKTRPGRGRASRSSRDEREDEDDAGEERGRFGPPPKKNDSTMIVVAVIAAILIVVGVAAMGGGGSNLVDEHEAEKAYNYVDGQYALAKGGDALAENRGQLRNAFQKVVDTYPGTESAEKAQKRIRELQ